MAVFRQFAAYRHAGQGQTFPPRRMSRDCSVRHEIAGNGSSSLAFLLAHLKTAPGRSKSGSLALLRGAAAHALGRICR
jgi:hypothetical protein